MHQTANTNLGSFIEANQARRNKLSRDTRAFLQAGQKINYIAEGHGAIHVVTKARKGRGKALNVVGGQVYTSQDA